MKVVQVYGAYYIAPDTKGYQDEETAQAECQRLSEAVRLIRRLMSGYNAAASNDARTFLSHIEALHE